MSACHRSGLASARQSRLAALRGSVPFRSPCSLLSFLYEQLCYHLALSPRTVSCLSMTLKTRSCFLLPLSVFIPKCEKTCWHKSQETAGTHGSVSLVPQILSALRKKVSGPETFGEGTVCYSSLGNTFFMVSLVKALQSANQFNVTQYFPDWTEQGNLTPAPFFPLCLKHSM